MEVWTQWLDAIRALLQFLSSEVGLGAGLGIVALTLLLRGALLPISWPTAYRGIVRQKKMKALQPLLGQLKEKYSKEPQRYAEEMLKAYRKHDLTPIDGRGILGGLAQLPLFLGMYQMLRDGANGAKFLWVQSLSRPDVWLALIAGLTTMLAMAVNPDLPESMRLIIIVVPSVLAFLAALKFCSALAVYWTASNCFTALQTTALHWTVARRIRSGALRI